MAADQPTETKIYYNPEELADLGDTFTSKGDRLSTLYDHIHKKLYEELSTYWSGTAYDALKQVIQPFMNSFRDILPVVKQTLGNKFNSLSSSGIETTRQNISAINRIS